MSDLISREDLIKTLKEKCCGDCRMCNEYCIFENGVHHCGLIDNAPTVVNEKLTSEKSQGEWIKDDWFDIVCSNCGGVRRDHRVEHINYCNKCGAKMKRSDEE